MTVLCERRYNDDHTYALPTVYFFLVTIALFALGYLVLAFQPRPLSRNRLWQRGVALFRYLSYRGFGIEQIGWTSPTLGVMLLGFTMAVFFLGRVTEIYLTSEQRKSCMKTGNSQQA